MTYTKYYAGGFVDWPNASTPVTAAALNHIESGINSGSEQHFVVAASDSSASQQASADYVCDGVADDVEINAAITAAAAFSGGTGPGTSILLRPGTYNLAAAVDFSPLAAVGQIPVMFDAPGAVFYPSTNLTSMFIVGYVGVASSWLSNRLNLRLGTIDGKKGTFTVTQAVYMRHCMDNKLYFHNIQNVSGNGVTVDQSPVSDYAGAFNNLIEIPRLYNCNIGFQVLSNTNVYQFQGNQVRVGDVTACGQGFVIGSATNDFAFWNKFEIGSIGDSTTNGLVDKCGRNIWIIGNTNTSGTFGISCPTGMATRSTFIVGSTSDSIDPNITNQHLVISGGAILSAVLPLGLQPGATDVEIRFHSGSSLATYDTRIYSDGGTGSDGGGNLHIGGGLIGLDNGTIWTNAAHEATGAGSAALGANCPAVTVTAPNTWLKFVKSDGSTLYVPAWK